MNIRKFQDADQNSLIDLWSQVFPDASPHNEPSSVIAAKLAVDDLIFVAEHDDKLVGACMAGYDGHRGWLYAIAVLDQERRRGVGTALVNYAIKALQDIGCIKVNLQIRSTNVEVEAFYRTLGFVTEERLSMGMLMDKGM